MSDPANPPTDPIARPPRPRKSFGATVKSRKRAQQIEDSRNESIARVITAELVDDQDDKTGNLLNNNELTGPQGSTQPSSSRMNNYARGQFIRRTREMMIANAERYARAHIESVERALAMSHIDPKYTDVARRGAEFALANISDDGERIISKEQHASPQPATIQIGIALGGLPHKQLKSADE